jgi:cell division protein FtsN
MNIYTVKRIMPLAIIKSRQSGGTLIGIVAGLVVGLAIALTVAIYVTKVPVPFVQKVTPAASPNADDEAKKNSTWDPNSPMYGKNPAGTKPKTTPEMDAAVNPNAPPPSVLPPFNPNAATAKPPKQPQPTQPTQPTLDPNDPIGQIAKATQSAAKPKPSATPGEQPGIPMAVQGDPWTYFLQAGAFRDQTQADAQRAKLALSGFDAKITEREQAGSPIYRVRMGPYNTLDDVNKAKAKLEAQGIEGATVRVPR